ncbi:MAG: hypothetical protein ABI882_00885, partial [Acidobacteriota bacterium]
MNTSSKSVSLKLRLALGLSLLACMVAGAASLSIVSTRAAAKGSTRAAAKDGTVPKTTLGSQTSTVIPRNRQTVKSAYNLATLASHSFAGSLPQGRLLRVQPSGVAPGGTLTLPVDFFAQGDEHSVQFSLRFDAGLFKLQNVEAGADAQGARLNLDYSRSSEGLLGVSIELPDGASFDAGNNRILSLSFSVNDGRAHRTTSVEFADEPILRGTADVETRGLLTSYTAGIVLVAAAIEGDVAPRPNGSDDGALTVGDWIQSGRFVAALDQAANGSEFQRADCAPRGTSGDGKITLADWVQAGRFSEGLDPAQAAAGPTAPTSLAEAGAIEAGSLTAGTEDEAQFRVVRAGDATFTRGQDNSQIIELDAQGDENAVAFSLNYNPAHMTFVRAVLGTGVPQVANPVLNVNTADIGLGRVGVALALRAGSNFGVGSRQLLVLTFTVPLGGNQNSTIVSFGDIPVGRGVANTNADAVTATFNQGAINFTPTVNAIPTLTTISPNFVIVGGPTFTLIVNGTDFVDGASVRVDGFERATRFVSSTELQAFIPASDIDETGVFNITVANPPPGGGVSQALQLSVNNPIPTVFGATPAVIGVNSGSQSITVTGSNFVPGAIVKWNGQNRQTSFNDSGQLTASLLAADVSAVGTQTVTVQNPGPGGGLSNEVSVSVIVASAIPRISALDPATWPTLGGAFQLRVIGTSFAPNAVVRWAGDPRPTTFVSNTELLAQISASDVATEQTVLVSVVNPPPGGGNSNNFPFVVQGEPNDLPVLNSISPDTVTSGGPDFTLTLNGSFFIASSVVQVNGQNRPTTFVSSTQLQATIFAADISAGGVAQIRVFTPLPGGGNSQTLSLTIGQGAPTIVFLSPNSALVGGPGFTLNIIGNSFTSNSVVRWNGSPRTTTFINGTELHAEILASDIAAVGTALVSVLSPPPGGGASNSVTFSIVVSDNPLPRINSISPTQTTAGSPAFTLTVNGTGYFTGSLVRWNGSPRQTTFISATQLTALITAADVQAVGTSAVTVFNSAPGGGVSNSVSFAVTSVSGLPPVITNITPTTVSAGGQGFTLAVEGANFTPTSVVQFNSDTRPTTFISANQLIALISADDLTF